MRPEQPGTGQASQRWRPDRAPRGGRHADLLRGFFCSARPPPFCFPLPRVHAADAVAAQPAQTPPSTSSSSTGPAPTPISLLRTTPGYVGGPELPDTGWSRIKDLIERQNSEQYPEEVTNVLKGSIIAALVGLCYGGVVGGRHARQRYIEVSKMQIYTSQMEAVTAAQNAAIRGFVKYGWRWSWRLAMFVTLFNSINTVLCVYRDKHAVSHFTVAGAVTGGLFRVNLGLRGLVSGTLIGALLGIPTGVFVVGLQFLAGGSIQEKRRKERRELHERQVAEWEARMQLTDELIDQLDVSCQGKDTTEDVERIGELLAAPQK